MNFDLQATPQFAEFLNIVLNELLVDIQEANLPCTVGSTVTFNIGGQTYARNRSAIRTNTNENKKVYMNEEIIPKIEYTIERLGICEPGANFVYNNNNIRLSCQFCNEDYLGLKSFEMLLEHMKSEHSDEIDVICPKCKATFAVFDLVARRWKHSCTNNTQ